MKLLTSVLILAISYQVLAEEITSVSIRENKKFSVLFSPIGFGPNIAFSTGGFLSYNFSANTALEFEYMNDYPFRSAVNDNYGTVSSSYAFSIKQFVADSFYLRAGVGNKSVNYKYLRVDLPSNVTTTLGRFSGNAIVGLFAIGNQWSFDTFVMGCDWIGISNTLTYNLNESFDVIASDSDKNRTHTDEQSYLKNAVPLVTRFYLGMSF